MSNYPEFAEWIAEQLARLEVNLRTAQRELVSHGHNAISEARSSSADVFNTQLAKVSAHERGHANLLAAISLNQHLSDLRIISHEANAAIDTIEDGTTGQELKIQELEKLNVALREEIEFHKDRAESKLNQVSNSSVDSESSDCTPLVQLARAGALPVGTILVVESPESDSYVGSYSGIHGAGKLLTTHGPDGSVVYMSGDFARIATRDVQHQFETILAENVGRSARGERSVSMPPEESEENTRIEPVQSDRSDDYFDL